jgi:hypothetical protein
MESSNHKELAAEVELEAVKSRIASRKTGENVEMAPGPFGRMYPIKRFAGVKQLSFRNPNGHLDEPEKLIAHPEPGYRYAWPKADDDGTKGKLRDGHYIKVTLDELDPHTGFAIATHKGTSGGKDIRWYGHVLVKIPPEAYEELYEFPVEQSKTRMQRETEAFQEKVSYISKGVAKPSVEIGVETGPV